MKFRAHIILFLIIIFIAGCQSVVDIEKEKAALLKTDAEFSSASVKMGAPEAFHQYLANDAVQLPARLNPIFGRDSIYQSMKNSGDDYILQWMPRSAEVAESGDLGYTWGLYTITWQDENGDTLSSFGKYLNVWRKQEDGCWKVVVDMGNLSPPPFEE